MPGGDRGGERRVIGIDDRIGEAADTRHHRHAAIAQAIELRQPAGLEARRQHDRIGAALDQMRERLVEAGDDADAALMNRGGDPEHVLDGGVPRAEHDQAGAARDQAVDRRAEQVHALLPGQAADHGEDDSVAARERRSASRLPLVGGALLRPVRAVAGDEMRIGRRVPDVDIDAVDDAGEHAAAAHRKSPSRPMPPRPS